MFEQENRFNVVYHQFIATCMTMVVRSVVTGF